MRLEPRAGLGDTNGMELFEDASPDAGAGNAPPLSVSEISGAVRRVIEGEFGRVRVRGEVGRVSRPSSGHLYFDLKDDRAVIAAVCWRDNACRLPHRPEEGIEVIVTGRLTTFPGQSKYQLLVESVEPAGIGALMAMLDQRRRLLAAEGLFDAARKRPIPYLPDVIAVVTSPSGAVIRDILHRLRDRFPSRVLIWPVAVQGAQSAPQVAAAVARLNAIEAGGAIPRPDLIIVARGGGSVEDLWGFNDEAVVRAVAAGTIPLISAVGHETDTTLIDHAADLRAPTPTAAAELAVPVLAELGARVSDSQARLWRSVQARIDRPAQRLGDLGRGLGRPQALTDAARQRLDLTGPRLEPMLRSFMRDRRRSTESLDLPLYALRSFMADRRAGYDRAAQALTLAARRERDRRSAALPVVRAAAVRMALAAAGRRLEGQRDRIEPALARRQAAEARRLRGLGSRLDAARGRMIATARRDHAERRAALEASARRLAALGPRLAGDRRQALGALDRLRQTLGHTETLRRGFVIVRGPEGLLTSAAAAARVPRLDLEFHDGHLGAVPEGGPGEATGTEVQVPGANEAVPAEPPKPRPPGRTAPPRGGKPTSSGQGSLF